MNMHYFEHNPSTNGKAFRAWSGCLVGLTRKTSRIAEARHALNRQALMGEAVQTDRYLNTLETLLTEMADDLERASGHLPVNGMTPIWKSIRSFTDTEGYRQSRHLHRQILKATTEWLRAASGSVREGGKLFADPETVERGFRRAIDQYEAQMQQTHQILTDWMDTAGDQMAQVFEMSAPFLWMVQSAEQAAEAAPSETDAPDNEAE